MGEVALLPFARITPQVSRAVLPRYPLPKSFQPAAIYPAAMLAILCQMRYKDWTFHDAEVR